MTAVQKQIAIIIVALTLIGICVLWVVDPDSISYFSNIWSALGRPSLGKRIVILFGFIGGMFFLGLRVLKSGPM